jgi:hypothetical protein
MKRSTVLLFLFALVLYADAPWLPNVRVSVDEPWDTLNQGESCLAVYGDTVVSICNTAERGQVPVAPYAYSFDGGQTFVQIPFTDNTTGIGWHTDPVIAFDDSGHVHMLMQFSVNMLKHYLSRDGGQTWEDTSVVFNTYGVDKPWMVVNNNEIYICWQQTSGTTGINFAKSIDYGMTWDVNQIWNRTGITALCVDEYDILHLCLVHWSIGNVYYRRSTDMGETWSNEIQLGDFAYNVHYGDRAPINTITARNNIVFAAWVDEAGGTWDISAVRSEDGGATWSSEYIVNDIVPGGQCKVWALFDVYGGLHVSYYHTPDWPSSSSSLFSFRYQYSPDGGISFHDGIRVSDTSVVSLDDFIGEYHITQADSEYLYAQWTDGRNGDYNDLYFSKALLSDLAVSEDPKDGSIVNRVFTAPAILHNNAVLTIPPHEYPVDIRAYDVSGRMIKKIYAGTVDRMMRIQLDPNEFPQGVIFLYFNSPVCNASLKIVNIQ